MKKQTSFFLFLAAMLLASACASIKSASAQQDFNALYGKEIADSQIDGAIGTEWDDAGKQTNVAIVPTGTADIWTKNDGNNLYIAVRITADSNNPWVAVQLGGNECMAANTDAALFGNDDYSANGYKDIYLTHTGGADVDSSQDGIGAISVSPSNVVTIELKKSLSSNDSGGHDINWATGQAYNLIVIWDSNGRGSSGGTAGHASAFPPTMKTILIHSKSVDEPQNSGTTMDTIVPLAVAAVIVIAILAIAIVFRKRRRQSSIPETKPNDLTS
jgi:hypothetical protein